MTADDDPERRIRDLEGASHPGVPEPGPSAAQRAGWIVLALLIAALAGGGVVLLGRQADRPVAGTPVADGDAVGLTDGDAVPPPAGGVRSPASAGPVTVAGVETTQTVDCDGMPASVSGVGNTVVLTGRCTRVEVSGVNNTVTLETAQTIVVSGLSNGVTFRSGDPDIENSGVSNTVQRG